jgi:hypothetical protein
VSGLSGIDSVEVPNIEEEEDLLLLVKCCSVFSFPVIAY